MLVLCIKHLLPSKEHGKGTSKGQRDNMLRLSPFLKLNIGRHPNRQKCNRPNRAETKRDKAKDARKKSLDEVSAEQITCILT